jgi:8-oxo-dGTP diphosphatase
MAPLLSVLNERTNHRSVIVAAAIIEAGRLLGCARSRPPELAGFWELPGGKREPDETDAQALIRECREELAVRIEVAEQIGSDVPIPGSTSLLRVYLARLVGEARPQPLEHAAVRWLTADELDSVPWLPADAPVLAALRPRLTAELA